MRRQRRRRELEEHERGETLIEILVTVAILAVGVIGIMPALANSLSITDRFRKQAKVDQAVTELTEAVQNAPYACDSSGAGYGGVISGVATATGQTIALTQFDYWRGGITPPDFATPGGGWVCPTIAIDKTQRLKFRVSSPDSRGSRFIQVVKRP